MNLKAGTLKKQWIDPGTGKDARTQEDLDKLMQHIDEMIAHFDHRVQQPFPLPLLYRSPLPCCSPPHGGRPRSSVDSPGTPRQTWPTHSR